MSVDFADPGRADDTDGFAGTQVRIARLKPPPQRELTAITGTSPSDRGDLPDARRRVVAQVELVEDHHRPRAAAVRKRQVALEPPRVEVGVEAHHQEGEVDVRGHHLLARHLAGGLAADELALARHDRVDGAARFAEARPQRHPVADRRQAPRSCARWRRRPAMSQRSSAASWVWQRNRCWNWATARPGMKPSSRGMASQVRRQFVREAPVSKRHPLSPDIIEYGGTSQRKPCHKLAACPPRRNPQTSKHWPATPVPGGCARGEPRLWHEGLGDIAHRPRGARDDRRRQRVCDLTVGDFSP